jgi:membrane fusion protein (multidrug efflux system)
MAEDDKNRNTETPASAAPGSGAAPAAAAPQPAPAAPAPRQRRRWLRASLLVLGPVLVLVIGAYIYMNTGRYTETDNAYLKSDMVLVSAEVGGPIQRVAVRENQRVQAGDVLFEIDDAPYLVMVERGKSQVQAVESFITGLEASYKQQLEQLELARINVAYNERELERQQGLAARNLGSDVDVDRAQHEYAVAKQQIPLIEQALAQLRAQIGGQIVPSVGVGAAAAAAFNPSAALTGNAALRTVKAMLQDAKLDLEHTVVHAPFDGVVSRVPTVGRYVAPGNPVMSLVADRNVWVEANYKETELTHVEPGQPVSIRVDTYPDLEWRGKVESISPATGAEFSVIPAQNASGNWVKVAQRIPVRISVDVRPGDPPLRTGMSATVEIDTGFEREAPAFLTFLRVSSVATAAPIVEHN